MYQTEMLCPRCKDHLMRDSDGFLACLSCHWTEPKDVKMPKEKTLKFCVNCQRFYDDTDGHNPSHLLFPAYGTFMTQDEKSADEGNKDLRRIYEEAVSNMKKENNIS